MIPVCTRTIAWRMVAVIAVAASVGYAAVATAQSPQVGVNAADDLRAVYANAADVADGARVAQTTCAACHGANGVSTVKDIPNLAGQRPAYLYTELRAYQSGARGNSTMGPVVRYLKDDALVKVAAYYASLEPAQPSVAAGKPAPAPLDPVRAGKALAAPCAGCHGDDGISKLPGTPSLTGLDPKYLVAAMKAYKSGQRSSDAMKPMVAGLTDQDMSNVALYYALQKPARAATPTGGDAAAGKDAAAACAGCHGDKGVSGNPAIPSLAGQDAQYLVAALHAYKGGARSDETMKGLAAALDDAATKNAAAFYASQEPSPPHVQKPLTTAEWVQRCDRCHGVDGNSTDPRLPALAAQRLDYLQKVLHAYRTGERKSPQMAAMSDVLSEADVENLAAHYSRQKARAVVYIAVPARSAK
jgi:cytochrome c553